MSTVTLQCKIDADDKREFEQICRSIGMNVSTAINIYVKKVIAERRIPFELSDSSNRDNSNCDNTNRWVDEILREVRLYEAGLLPTRTLEEVKAKYGMKD